MKNMFSKNEQFFSGAAAPEVLQIQLKWKLWTVLYIS